MASKATPRSKHKYRAKSIVVDGMKFDSEREFQRWCELKLREKAGEISHLERQPKFALFGMCGQLAVPNKNGYRRRLYYYGDFRYFDHGRDRRVVEDVKGMDTAVSRIKRALVEQAYSVTIEVVR